MRLIKKFEDFDSLIKKYQFENQKYGGVYTFVMMKLISNQNLDSFIDFLMDKLRISDSIFVYNDKIILILEETSVRGAFILNNRLREYIQDHNLGFFYVCSVIQLDYISSSRDIIDFLEKRLQVAERFKPKECVDDITKFL